MRRRSALKLFFATDLHGSEACFRKFLAAARVYEVDALVLGGDLTGKALRPLVSNGRGWHRGLAVNGGELLSDEAADEYAKQAADAGTYCVKLDLDEAERLHDSVAVDRRLTHEAAERVAAWVRLAEERLAGTEVQLFITAGNDDPPEVLAAAATASGESVVYCDGDVTTIRDTLEMVSMGYSNPTPWDTPRELSEDELRASTEALIARLERPEESVFNLHVPPVSSGLDRCPELDTSTDPPSVVRIGGEIVIGAAGSRAVREVLEEHQPLVGLHGHIHESRASAKIGSSLALNPGSDYGDAILRGVIVAVKGRRVVHQFTAG